MAPTVSTANGAVTIETPTGYVEIAPSDVPALIEALWRAVGI